MKNKKNFILLFSLLPGLGLTSCSLPKANVGIYLAIDGATHDQNDKSFNQQPYEAINEYLSLELSNDQKEAYAKKPAGDRESDFLQLYASIPKHSTIIASGFTHQAPLSKAVEETKDKKIIFLDGILDTNNDGVQDQRYQNIASIEFKIQQAAYFAGYAFAQYAASKEGYLSLKNQNNSTYDHSTYVDVGAYGGADIPSVTGFMGGFEFGFEDAKNEIKKEQNVNEFPYANQIRFIHLENKPAHFSNDFAVGKGIMVTKALNQKGADVILGVAGPQIRDTLDNFKGLIIGPDTDQTLMYPSEEDRFLFSIVKNLKLATFNMLKKINGDVNISPFYQGLGKTTVGDWESKLVGISNNTPAITKYYNDALTKPHLIARAEAIKNLWFFDDYEKYGYEWIDNLGNLPNQ